MTDPREAVERLREAYNRHDLVALARSFGERAVLVSPDGIAEDRDEIASYYGVFMEAFPDTIVTPQTVGVYHDTLAAEFIITGTHEGPLLVAGGEIVPATGRPIAVRACSLSTVEDGLIASHRLYYDQLELGVQLGGDLRFAGPP
ncbi:hypothetical protein Sru01_36290 [Sphaerisporangium rufum]|uniref:SnoaL-like domain-containing protein n=1 Tax=Sphaerisporangium rufum TaxID=1381558 RepID=A0A919R2U2_9ACTN|nr:nuclear transport factor 2 family protein [Sphaerisporangium rufum]GII78647.1 hypothetical protein Sru01_36290 [Sphaerisporangium rufum]